MLAAAASMLCCYLLALIVSVILLAAGKPLTTPSVVAAAGTDVALPCHRVLAQPSHVDSVEWSRVEGQSLLTVHVLRGGVELVKEQAPAYLGRTAVMEDGSLKLLRVQQGDSGTYRCVLLGGSPVRDQVFVSLIVVEVSEIYITVRRTSANELFVLCESSGWSQQPHISLLDGGLNGLDVHTETWDGPDGLRSVRASTKVAAAGGQQTGNTTFICRVGLPEGSLMKENQIHISDEWRPAVAGVESHAVMLLCVTAVLIVAFVVLLGTNEKLRASAQRLPASCVGLMMADGRGKGDQPLLSPGAADYTEYGDIIKVETTGASEETAKANSLRSSGGPLLTGVEVSNEIAKRHWTAMQQYTETIIRVGQNLRVHPALIAAIVSRQSEAGTNLRPNGFGQCDPNCFGLMQINKNYHAVKGGAFSEDHLDQGVTFLIQLIKTMQRTKPDWTKEQQLKGALACYIAGEDRVIPVSYEEVDSVTPYGDFASDVVARAHWFADNGF